MQFSRMSTARRASAYIARITVPRDSNHNREVLTWFVRTALASGVTHAPRLKSSSNGTATGRTYTIGKRQEELAATLAASSDHSSVVDRIRGPPSKKTGGASDPAAAAAAAVSVPPYSVAVAAILESDLSLPAYRIAIRYPSANYLLVYHPSIIEGNPTMCHLTIYGALPATNCFLEQGRTHHDTSSNRILRAALLGYGADALALSVSSALLRLDMTPLPHRDRAWWFSTCDKHTAVSLSTRMFRANTPQPLPPIQGHGDPCWVINYVDEVQRWASNDTLRLATKDKRPARLENPYYIVDQLQNGAGDELSFRADELPYYLGYLRRVFEMALFMQEISQRDQSVLTQDDEMQNEHQRMESYMLDANLLKAEDRERDYKCRLLVSLLALRLCMKARSRRLAEQADQTEEEQRSHHPGSSAAIEAPAQLLLRTLAWMFAVRHHYVFRTERQNLELACSNGSPLDAATPMAQHTDDTLESLNGNCPDLSTTLIKDGRKEYIYPRDIPLRSSKRAPVDEVRLWFTTELIKTRVKDETLSSFQQELSSSERHSTRSEMQPVLAQALADRRNAVVRYDDHIDGGEYVLIFEPLAAARSRMENGMPRGATSNSIGHLQRVACPCTNTMFEHQDTLLQVLVGVSELPTIFYTTIDERLVSRAPGFMELMAACLDRIMHYPEEFEGRDPEGQNPRACMGPLTRIRENQQQSNCMFAVIFYGHLYGELEASAFSQIRARDGLTYVFLPTLIAANGVAVKSIAVILSKVMRVHAASVCRQGAKHAVWLPPSLTPESASAILGALDSMAPTGVSSIRNAPYQHGYVFRVPPGVGFEVHPCAAELIEICPRTADQCLQRINIFSDIYRTPLCKADRDRWDDYEMGRFMLGNRNTAMALPTLVFTVPVDEMDHSMFAAPRDARSCVFCLPPVLATSVGASVVAAARGGGGKRAAPIEPTMDDHQGASTRLLNSYRCSACEHNRLQHLPGMPHSELYIGITYRDFCAWQYGLSLKPARRVLASLDAKAGGIAGVAACEDLDAVMGPLGTVWSEMTSTLDHLMKHHHYFTGDLTSDMRVRFDLMHRDAQHLQLITGEAKARYSQDEIDRIRLWIAHDPEAFYSVYKGPAAQHFYSGSRSQARWGARGSFAVALDEYHTGRKGDDGKDIVLPAGSWIDFGNSDERGDVYDFVIREKFNRDKKAGFIPAVRACHLWLVKTYGAAVLNSLPGQSRTDELRQKRNADRQATKGYKGGSSAPPMHPDEFRQKDARLKWGAASKLVDKPDSRAYLGVRYLRDTRGITSERVLFDNDCFRFMPVFNLQDAGMGGSRADYPALVVAVYNPMEVEKRVVLAMQAIALNAATINKAENIRDQKRTTNSSGAGTAALIQYHEPTKESQSAAQREFGACIAIGEGPETMASVAQACPELEVWCTLGISNIRNFPYVGALRSGDPDNWGYGIIICADNDLDASGAPDAAKINSVERAAAELASRGYAVRITRPAHIKREGGEKGTDFNDVLRLLQTGGGDMAIRKTLKTGKMIMPKAKEVPKPPPRTEDDAVMVEVDITPKEVLRARALEAIKKKQNGGSKDAEEKEEESSSSSSSESEEEPKAKRVAAPTKQSRLEDSATTRKFITKKQTSADKEDKSSGSDSSSSSSSSSTPSDDDKHEDTLLTKAACKDMTKPKEIVSSLRKLLLPTKASAPEPNDDDELDIPAEDIAAAQTKAASAEPRRSRFVDDD